MERFAANEWVQDVGKEGLIRSIVDDHSAGCCKKFVVQEGILCGFPLVGQKILGRDIIGGTGVSNLKRSTGRACFAQSVLAKRRYNDLSLCDTPIGSGEPILGVTPADLSKDVSLCTL